MAKYLDKSGLQYFWEKIKFVGHSNRRVVFVGDSYMYMSDDMINGFLLRVPDISYQKVSEGGAGFAKTGDNGHTFATLFSSTTITSADKVTDVILLGGTNDNLQSAADIRSGINSFISAVHTKCQKATIYFGMVGLINNYEQQYQLRTKVLPMMRNTQDVVYLSGIEFVNHNYGRLIDDRHPDANKRSEIGNWAANIWLGQGCDYTEHLESTTVKNLYTESDVTGVSFVQNLTNGIVTLNFNCTNSKINDFTVIGFGNAYHTIQPNSNVGLFNYPAGMRLACAPYNHYMPKKHCKIRLYKDSGYSTYEEVDGLISTHTDQIFFWNTKTTATAQVWGFGVPGFDIKISANMC